MKKVTVIFPMAGEGQRFGNKFKPFLKIFNKTFIEMAIEPFLKHKDEIKRIVFIVRTDHEKPFHVHSKITEFNLPVPTSIIYVEPTKNVIETISPLFDDHKFIRDVIFCDCDHWLNVDEIFEAIQKDEYDCIVPGWEIDPNESKKWSIAAVDENNMVKSIAEKKWPSPSERFYGVIGCYYFRKLYYPKGPYMSDVINFYLIVENKVKLIPIKEAEFFGDPQRLENLYISKNACTIFCDLDGTVIEHENIPDYTKGISILPGAKDKIDEWRKDNAFIVLTTSRDEQNRVEVESMLRSLGIRYESLIMGLPPGPRYLINDKKPYSDKEMARAFEVERNKGIASIGHSFATFKSNGETFGHKSIPADSPAHQRDKFRWQYQSMYEIRKEIELRKLIPDICGFTGLSYDIEYLKDYQGLHNFNQETRLNFLSILFEGLWKLYDKRVDYPLNWLGDFIEKKILGKFKDLEGLGLSTDILTRIAETYRDHAEVLKPTFLVQYFHGDLTYENIMCYNDDIKLIDLDNDNLPGPVELDMGKLMQSILTGYEQWEEGPLPYSMKDDFDVVIDFYTTLLLEDRRKVINKAYFYCSLHLIRMIPYQARIDKKRGELALFWAENILNRIKWNTSTNL